MRERNKMFNLKERSDLIYQVALFLFLFTLPLENRYSNLGLIVLSAAWLLHEDKRAALKVFRKYAYILIILNLLWFLFGLIFSYQEYFSDYLEKIGKFILLVLLPILIIPARNLDRKQLAFSLSGFVFSIILILLISYGYAAGQYQSGAENPFNYSIFVSGSGDYHPAYISMFVVCSFFLCLEGLKIYNSRFVRLMIYLILLVLFTSVFVIQARTAILAFGLLIPVYFILGMRKGNTLRTSVIFTFTALILGGIFIWFSDSTPVALMKERVINGFSNSMSIRMDTWTCALEVFRSNSWVYGVGSGNELLALKECYYQNFLTRQFFDNFNTHNHFLLILVRNGIVGLLLWFGFLGSLIIRNYEVRNYIGVIFVLLFCVCGLTEGLLSRIWGILFIGTGIGFCLLSYFDDARFIGGKLRITNG